MEGKRREPCLPVERLRRGPQVSGLGLAGAVAINLCGGLVLAGWLTFAELELPPRGWLFLWALVLLLVGLSGLEIAQQIRARAARQDS